MTELTFTNARIILSDEVVNGSLSVEGGKIKSFDSGSAKIAEDFDGDYLIPGLVELHTDHLESHFQPRPGVEWPAHFAIIAHDAQIAAAGITTVFDALRAGSFDPSDISARQGEVLAVAIHAAVEKDHLRADHFIHIRCELPCPDTIEVLQSTLEQGGTRLISIMDHTPGWRQFTSMDKFKEYYLGKKLILPENLDAYIAEKLEMQARYASVNKIEILKLARQLHINLASHDDATIAHVDEAVEDGAVIAEFPTSAASAKAAHEKGLAVLMGAPNVVRGGSHSGNISALEVAASGHLDILSSDYVPSSLLQGAFTLAERVEAITLPKAIYYVSEGPARAAGLDDRGVIQIGKRADLIQVSVKSGQPVLKKMWREGQRVL
jgi:alpha-D-ribose 1-methylphosphonate 5-triphosphate diphosphatase